MSEDLRPEGFGQVSESNLENVERMRARARELNAISPSMCLAKWMQSTVYLQNGYTHSCHHPPPHKIPLHEVRENPSALHNTSFKKAQRQKMLAGLRPKECDYCWRIEDLGPEHISDRIYKSTDLETAWPFRRAVLLSGSKGDISPSYLEVSFSHQCNLKCAYCSPEVSSKWMEEILAYGPYPTSKKFNSLEFLKSTDRLPIPRDEPNPYVEAFWKWWPELYPKLKVFRITGGEPLLSEHTWRMLDLIAESPREDLKLAVNSNFCVPEKQIDRLIEIARRLKGRVKSFEIYTSCEASGPQAEYARFGMKYETFIGNVRRYLKEAGADSRVNFMTTFNILSLTTFNDFLAMIFALRAEFNEKDSHNRIPLMVSYLRWPDFLSVSHLPESLRCRYADEYEDFVGRHTVKTQAHPAARFYLEELEQVRRLSDFMRRSSPKPSEVSRLRKDFASYVAEYDRRRGTDFKATFPELADFLSSCR